MKALGYGATVLVSIVLGGMVGIWSGFISWAFFGPVGGFIGFFLPMLLIASAIMNGYSEGKAKATIIKEGEEE